MLRRPTTVFLFTLIFSSVVYGYIKHSQSLQSHPPESPKQKQIQPQVKSESDQRDEIFQTKDLSIYEDNAQVQFTGLMSFTDQGRVVGVGTLVVSPLEPSPLRENVYYINEDGDVGINPISSGKYSYEGDISIVANRSGGNTVVTIVNEAKGYEANLKLDGSIDVGGSRVTFASGERIDAKKDDTLRLTSDGDIMLVLGDTEGDKAFKIYDAEGKEKVFEVDSNGNLEAEGTGKFDGKLTIKSGGASITGTVNITGDTSLFGDTTIGTSSSDVLTLNSRVGSDIVPSVGSTYSLGSASNPFTSIYADNLVATTTEIAGTKAESLTLDTDNTGGNLSLVFGTVLDEQLYWNSTSSRFQMTDDLYVENLILDGATIGLPTDTDLLSLANNALTVNGSAYITGTLRDSSNSAGSSGYYLQSTGTGTSWTQLSAGSQLLPSGSDGQTLYNNGGVWTANSGLYFDDVNNRLGIGTTSPAGKLEVSGTPQANITTGMLNIGTLFGQAGTGYFGYGSTASANGTLIAGNVPSSYTGDLINLQVASTSNFRVTNAGSITATGLRMRSNSTSYLSDSWGFVYNSAGQFPLKVSGASLLLGYSSAGVDMGSGNLYVSGNTGLGTTSPNDKLEILSTSDAQLRLAYDTSNYQALQVASDGGLTWSALGTDADLNFNFAGATDGDFSVNSDDLFVDTSTGNVGIGNTSPTHRLAVSGSLSVGSAGFIVDGSGASVVTGILGFPVARGAYGSASAPTYSFGSGSTDNGMFQPGQGISDAVGFSTGGTERLRIDSLGNVGIGTDTPYNKLHVRASAVTDSDIHQDDVLVLERNNDIKLNLIAGPSFGAGIQFSDDVRGRGFINYGFSTETMTFGTNGSGNRMIIDSTGNLGLNTTAFGSNAQRVFAISNSIAPSTAITDGIQLFAVDQAGSHELRVMDEAANITTLSPHNFSLIEEGPSEDMAWSFYSEREGVAVNADMTKALRLIEGLTGEKLIYKENILTGESIPYNNSYEVIKPKSSKTTTSEPEEAVAQPAPSKELGTSDILALLKDIFQVDEVLTFLKETVFEARAIFKETAVFEKNLEVKGAINAEVISASGRTAGVVVVPKDVSSTIVAFDQEFSSVPLIQLTPLTKVQGNYWIEEVTQKGFTIKFDESQDEETRFNWFAITSSDDTELTGESTDEDEETPVEPTTEENTEEITEEESEVPTTEESTASVELTD